jgi:hypothetical protein
MEFVHVCDLMYIYIVGKDTFRDERVQDPNVYARTLTTAAGNNFFGFKANSRMVGYEVLNVSGIYPDHRGHDGLEERNT